MQLPRHVAIVMDGNGRWAKSRGLPRVAGHKAGAQSVRVIIEAAAKKGIEVLTLFAFSTENWDRPAEEVKFLLGQFFKSINDEIAKLHQNNIRFYVIGDRQRFDTKLQQKIVAAEQLTANNTGLKLVIALSYSGRWDILQAVQKIGTEIAAHRLTVAEITQAKFQAQLCLDDMPEPDLFIRTSGEYRISNFLLWQLAYTELYFTTTLWPDFNEQCFDLALAEYAKRERRYGKVQ